MTTRPSTYPLWLLLMGLLLSIAACTDGGEDEPFALDGITGNTLTLDRDEGSETTLPFHAATRWQATSTQEWLTVSPSEGEAGDYDLRLRLMTDNLTGAERTALVRFTAGTRSFSLEVTQRADGYFKLKEESYEVAAAGGDLQVRFDTDIPDASLFIGIQGADWIQPTTKTTGTKTINPYYVGLTLLPNTESRSRTAYLVFRKTSGTPSTIGSVKITQAGTQSDTSTDYSADGLVTRLQQATRGSGIPIVLMGDGFIDREIADGTYQRILEQATEHLFSEEPIRTLRDYFTIYGVTAVSRNNAFGDGFSTAFSCRLEGGGSTLIEGDEQAVKKYLTYVGDAQTTEWLEREALVIVLLNTPQYAGTTAFGFINEAGNPIELAVAYCPVIDNMEGDAFRQVLQHEAVGHGFAKLMDEYAYEENGAIPADKVESYRTYQQHGWAQNVDFTADASQVLWQPFLSDYADEGIGIYEGACTYVRGAYRPTEVSIMNTNTGGYNAPSRKAIYDRVLRSSGGETSDYATFRTFDRQLSLRSATGSRATTPTKPFAPPRFVGRRFAQVP